ncbi:hypothetical protein OG709_35820 (plasmid) [Streptomyces sp. NBC_01267]|uniref:hypothetical protein n=1 Tax=Streptomyces sp. NBC_01267 TaxID=2903805 RepID=UPI002E37E944|nr:hypothetical protein [Streptomyces sp. NBC_01267]
MTASLRQQTITLASAAIEGASMAAALIGGAGGAYLGYQVSPTTWSGDVRILAAGAIAVVGAVAIDGLAETLALTSLRRMLMNLRTAVTSTRPKAPAPAATLGEALDQVVTATEEDAAHRAANASFRIDDGDKFLRNEDRWRGYEDGEASFYLAPGVVLHYRGEKDEYRHHFTLLTGDSEQPVAVTGMEEIRHHLAARAAGLPAVPVTADGDADKDDVLDIDLTGLNAV